MTAASAFFGGAFPFATTETIGDEY